MSQYARHNPTERPYTPYSSTERDDMKDEMRADLNHQRRAARRLCLECGCNGYHVAGCPAADDGDDE
jgi:hypothetical protein